MSFKFVFALTLLPILLCSCGKTEEVSESYILFEGDTNTQSGTTAEISQLPSFDKKDYDETDVMEITVTNNSEQGLIIIDIPFGIQKMLNGEWYTVPTVYGIAGHAAGIADGETYDGEAWLSPYSCLDPGHYRVISSLSFEQEYANYFISCEFDVK